MLLYAQGQDFREEKEEMRNGRMATGCEAVASALLGVCERLAEPRRL